MRIDSTILRSARVTIFVDKRPPRPFKLGVCKEVVIVSGKMKTRAAVFKKWHEKHLTMNTGVSSNKVQLLQSNEKYAMVAILIDEYGSARQLEGNVE